MPCPTLFAIGVATADVRKRWWRVLSNPDRVLKSRLRAYAPTKRHLGWQTHCLLSLQLLLLLLLTLPFFLLLLLHVRCVAG